MKTIAILALMTTLAATSLPANDNAGTVLQRQVGQKVEIRLKSGEKITGKVEAVGASAVHLSSLAGQEFYDAVVILDDVSAIVIRTDRK